MPTDGCMWCGAHGRPLRLRWPKHGCELLRHDVANGVGPPSPRKTRSPLRRCRCRRPATAVARSSQLGFDSVSDRIRVRTRVGSQQWSRAEAPAASATCASRRVRPTSVGAVGHTDCADPVYAGPRGTVGCLLRSTWHGCVLCAGWFGRARLLKHCRMSHVPTTLVCSCSIAKSNRTTLRNAVVPSIYSHR
jgi:hypothetical protein